MPLSYERDVEVRGILGQKFTTGLKEVDISCEGISAYTDLVNMTACGFGAPVFVSLPHFYRARPLHLQKLKGLRPNRKNHEFFATIEPVRFFKSSMQLDRFTAFSKVGVFISLVTFNP